MPNTDPQTTALHRAAQPHSHGGHLVCGVCDTVAIDVCIAGVARVIAVEVELI